MVSSITAGAGTFGDVQAGRTRLNARLELSFLMQLFLNNLEMEYN